MAFSLAPWRIQLFQLEIDRFLNGPVADEISAAVGPPVAATARATVQVRTGRLLASIRWFAARDEIGPFTEITSILYDMDLEAPADQLHRRYAGVVSALHIALPRIILL